MTAPSILNEAQTKRRIDTQLKKHPFFVWKPQGGLFSQGMPDYMIYYKSRLCFIEAKSSVGKPTPLQISIMKRLTDEGAYGFVIAPQNLDDVQKIIEYLYS